MGRIFSVLGVVAMTLIATNMVIGLLGGDFNAAVHNLVEKTQEWNTSRSGRPTPDQEAELETLRIEFEPLQKKASLHFLLGVLAALVAILVQSIGVTYFIGTGRWCKEVVEAYDLGPNALDDANRLKRRTFPWAMLGITTVLVIVTLGAASDPGRGGGSTAGWVPYHLFGGLGGTALLAYCMFRQWQGIHENQAVIDQLMQRVRVERGRRGLDVAENGVAENGVAENAGAENGVAENAGAEKSQTGEPSA